MIDLHIHSTASDGECLPYQIPIFGKESNVTALALTDHDTTDGLDEFLESASDVGVRGIPGVELSCSSSGIDKVHIVGLFINHKDSGLLDTLEQIRNWRDERNLKIIRKLDECGRHIELSEVMEVARCKRGSVGEVVLGRPHIAEVMVKRGYCRDIKSAFRDYLGKNQKAYVPRQTLDAANGIAAIHSAGGLAIWAHSMTTVKSHMLVTELCRKFKEFGLDGMEVVYPDFSPSDTEFAIKCAENFNLLKSGGTDFHGEKVTPGIRIGEGRGEGFAVPEAFLEAMGR